MQFAKWHGIGNDYIVIHGHDIPEAWIEITEAGALLARDVAQAICDRHRGIGGDGILVIDPSTTADIRMTIHNPDGSMAEMCGNGIRMAALFAVNRKLVSNDTFAVETAGGIVHPTIVDPTTVSVDMGKVVAEDVSTIILDTGAQLVGREISVGNPHFVTWIKDDSAYDLTTLPITELGPLAEHHSNFPNRSNIEWVERVDEETVAMRVWERGVGETQACGSGACAVAVAAVVDAGYPQRLTVKLPGGDLRMTVNADHNVTMTGPAVEAFRGTIDITQLMRNTVSSAAHQTTQSTEAVL